VGLWRVRVTIVAKKRRQCIVELHVTVNNITTFACYTTMFVWRNYVADSNKTNVGLHIKCSVVSYDFNKIRVFSQDFHDPPPNIKFHANPSGGSRTDTRGRSYMTKLTGAFGDNADMRN